MKKLTKVLLVAAMVVGACCGGVHLADSYVHSVVNGILPFEHCQKPLTRKSESITKEESGKHAQGAQAERGNGQDAIAWYNHGVWKIREVKAYV
jgi:hypothetical protein